MSLVKLDSCPITPECVSTHLFKDDENDSIVQYVPRTHDFKPHTCSVRSPESQKPVLAYMGEWFNHGTGRTRWVGPVRMRKSAEIAPKDEKYRNRGGSDPKWELLNVHVAVLNWEVDSDESTGAERP